MTTVAYIHGYDSDGLETTGKLAYALFNSGLPEVRIVRLNYPSKSKAPKIYKTLLDQIDKLQHSDKQVILVGTSLGGFWANYMGSYLGCAEVLINPVPKPSISLLKYLPKETGVPDSYTVFEGTGRITPKLPNTVCIGLKDDILDPYAIWAHYTKHHAVWFENEGHRFTDYAPVINIIQATINQLDRNAAIQDVPSGKVHQPTT